MMTTILLIAAGVVFAVIGGTLVLLYLLTIGLWIRTRRLNNRAHRDIS